MLKIARRSKFGSRSNAHLPVGLGITTYLNASWAADPATIPNPFQLCKYLRGIFVNSKKAFWVTLWVKYGDVQGIGIKDAQLDHVVNLIEDENMQFPPTTLVPLPPVEPDQTVGDMYGHANLQRTPKKVASLTPEPPQSPQKQPVHANAPQPFHNPDTLCAVIATVQCVLATEFICTAIASLGDSDPDPLNIDLTTLLAALNPVLDRAKQGRMPKVAIDCQYFLCNTWPLRPL